MCAAVSGVKFSKEDMSEARLREILKTVSVPEWAPSNKVRGFTILNYSC